jgi:hypothetical protein
MLKILKAWCLIKHRDKFTFYIVCNSWWQINNQLLLMSYYYYWCYYLSIYLWLYSTLLRLAVFGFLILHTVGRTLWTEDQPFARPLPTHRITQTQTAMTLVGFEPTSPVFEQAKSDLLVHSQTLRSASVYTLSANKVMIIEPWLFISSVNKMLRLKYDEGWFIRFDVLTAVVIWYNIG